jgi:hypothetical protein
MRTSLLWLFLGILAGTLIAIQRVFPSFLEGWLPLGHLPLYHVSVLLFGFAFPMLFGLWMMRLYQHRKQQLTHLPLFESGFIIWQFGLCWGLLMTIIGEHSSMPFWTWPAVTYGILLVGGCLFAAGFSVNIPKDEDAMSHRFLLAGAWSLPGLLLAFILMYQTRAWVAPSLFQGALQLSLVFLLVGLLVPLSLSRIEGPDTGRLRAAFWGGLLLLPLSASAFSAAIPGQLMLVVLQLIAALSVGVLIYTLYSWWSYPDLFRTHWRHHTSPAPTTSAIPTDVHVEGTAKDTTAALWLPSMRWGAICLGLAMVEGTIYTLVRLIGIEPSPTWSISHMTLLLLGTGVLWMQGLLCFAREPNAEVKMMLNRTRKSIFIGVLLVTLGCWWEALLHFYLEQNGLPRGSLASASGRWLRMVGALFLLMGLKWFALHVRVFMRNIKAAFAMKDPKTS